MATALILAGGLGTRLAPLVPHLPKSLAPIQGIPFLSLLLKQIASASFISRAVFALGFKAEEIQSFLKAQNYSLPLEFSVENTPMGTGGALLQALSKFDDEIFLVLNGDSYSDFSLLDFFQFHQRKKAVISIACRQVEDVSRYGAIEIDASQRICGFKEKSPLSQPGLVSVGVYLMNCKALKQFPVQPCSLEKDIFPHFLSQNLFAYVHSGRFIDIGTPDSYNEAQELLKPWIHA